MMIPFVRPAGAEFINGTFFHGFRFACPAAGGALPVATIVRPAGAMLESRRPLTPMYGHGSKWKACLLVVASCHGLTAAFAQTDSKRSEPVHTVEVTVELNTGGALTGAVVDFNDHGLVVVHADRPHVFSWDELKGASSYAVQKQLIHWRKRGAPLSAEEHLALGAYALRRGKKDIAVGELNEAATLDTALAPRVRELVAESRLRKRVTQRPFPAEDRAVDAESAEEIAPHQPTFSTLGERITSDIAHGDMIRTSAEVREQVLDIYRRFGQQVQEVLGKQVALVETDHFLIWTDWAKAEHDMIGEWCEGMYAELSRQFAVAPEQPVFLAKCPVFCFRSANRFRTFARRFDGYNAMQSAGYTRSIESNGHTHVVLLRFGDSEADYHQFAWTLVHEGTHAFLHRWHGSRLIPHWVNEGIAEWTADRVLGARCPAAENARLLARQYVSFNWPIRDMLESVGPIEVYQYALAHSVVAFLDTMGPGNLAKFVRGLKEGQSAASALADQWESMTTETLERQWRGWVRAAAPTESDAK